MTSALAMEPEARTVAASGLIVAVMLARNAATTIGYAIASLQWCDAIYLLADHCTDDTARMARKASFIPIVIEDSPFATPAFEFGEITVRNHAIDRAIASYRTGALVLADADELFAEHLRPFAERVANAEFSSATLSIFHLYDASRAIRYRETTKNGLFQMDPHVRIIAPHLRFVPLREGQLGHPRMMAGARPIHLHGDFHFHLKYLEALGLPNTSLEHLPTRLDESALRLFLFPIPFELPAGVSTTVCNILGISRDPPKSLSHSRTTCSVNLSQVEGESRQLCVLVTWGVPNEIEVVAQVLAAFRECSWAPKFDLCVVARSAPDGVEISGIEKLELLDGVVTDMVLQLSPDPEVSRLCSKLMSTVRRGVDVQAGRIEPTNILSIAYAKALQAGEEDLPTLAAMGCELI